jgi:hypothetical protein
VVVAAVAAVVAMATTATIAAVAVGLRVRLQFFSYKKPEQKFSCV